MSSRHTMCDGVCGSVCGSSEAELGERVLKSLRSFELGTARAYFKPAARVLEVGGGNGWQALAISQWVSSVVSIDTNPVGKWDRHYFPVKKYDGNVIPTADEEFDVVFSSNVLEHVDDLPGLLGEIRRVLKVGGVAVHIVPSVTWRLATLLTYYPWAISRIWSRMRNALRYDAVSDQIPEETGRVHNGLLRRMLLRAVDGAHGTSKSALHELRDFSVLSWATRLGSGGLNLELVRPTGLFYSGYMMIKPLSISARIRLAKLLGSSCHTFVLRKLPSK